MIKDYRPQTIDPRLENPGKRLFLKVYRQGSIVYVQSRRGLHSAGFTMIEMLIVVTLFAIIATASFAIFRMGVQIWRRSQGSALIEHKALFTLEKMTRDLRMSIRSELKDFKGNGDSDEIAIPSLIPIRAGKTDMIQYGLIHYEYNASKKEVCRREEPAAAIQGKKKFDCRVLANHVKRFKLQYLIYDGIGEAYSWYDSWDEKELPPLAIKIELQLDLPSQLTQYGQGGQIKTYKKTVRVPTGGKHEKDDQKP